MFGWTCHLDKTPGPRLLPSPPLPCPLPGLPGGGRAGGGRVRLLCLCKSICWWCIYGPVCVFLCNYPAQLSMAPLWPGLSLFICSMSRRVRSISALRQPRRPRAGGCFAGSFLGRRLPRPPAHLRGVCVGAPLASWAPCVSLSPGPRVSCECVSQSSGAGGSRSSCLAAPGAELNLGPAAARPALAALGRVSVRVARAGPGGALQFCLPPAPWPAGSLALPLLRLC